MEAHRVRRGVSAWMAAILVATAPLSVQAQDARPAPRAVRERHAVHFIIFRPQDRKFLEALDGAVASLKDGHEAVILFDGNSVTSLRMHMRRDRKTLLHDAPIGEPDRQVLAGQLGVPAADVPRNYLEYVQHLAKAGAKVFANRDAIRQYGLAEAEIHPVATLISVGQISEILDQTDFCFTVGGS